MRSILDWRFQSDIRDGWSVESTARAVQHLAANRAVVVPILNGFCTLFRRSVCWSIGLFDERNFPWGYGEEDDLMFRIAQRGFLSVVDLATFV